MENQLTPQLKSFYEEIIETEKNMPATSFLLLALTSIARVVSIDRLRVKSSLVRGRDGDAAYSNIYAMIVAPSGSGKDLLYGMFDKATHPIIQSAEGRYENWKKEVISDLKDESGSLDHTQAEARDYIRDRSPRNIMLTTEDGTPEGLMDIRASLERAQMGGMFIHHSEFAQVFEKESPTTDLFLEAVKKGYEGDTPAKITRHAKPLPPAKNVPMNMLVYTAPIDTTNDKSMHKFINFLNKGYARRMLFCFPQNGTVNTPVSFQEAKRNYKKQSKMLDVFGTRLRSIYDRYKEEEAFIFHTNDQIDELLYDYQQANLAVSKQFGKSPRDTAMKLEIEGRHWRTLKLSALIAVYEHPESQAITLEDVEAALWITETFTEELHGILSISERLPFEILFDILKKAEEPLGKTDIRCEHKEFDVPYNAMTSVINTALVDVVPYAAKEGYKLVDEAVLGGKQYSLEKI